MEDTQNVSASDIELSDLEHIAHNLANEGSPWHFHIAAAGCRIADGRAGVTFVLEDSNEGKTYRATATNDDLKVGERLARLLHGPDVFDVAVSNAGTADLSPEASALTKRARNLSDNALAWHHHMLFPDCAFNPNPGLWTLQLEGSDSFHEATSTSEPKAALAIIEKLFYAQAAIE